MVKVTTKSLVLSLVALGASSQGAYGAPVPGFSFKVPGVKGGTYRSSYGWGDVAKLDWKQKADASAKAAEDAAKGSSKQGGNHGATTIGAVAGTVADTGGVMGGVVAGNEDLGLSYDIPDEHIKADLY